MKQMDHQWQPASCVTFSELCAVCLQPKAHHECQCLTCKQGRAFVRLMALHNDCVALREEAVRAENGPSHVERAKWMRAETDFRDALRLHLS